MQCLLRRSNVCAIGRNATKSTADSSLRRQRPSPSPFSTTAVRHDRAINERWASSHPPATNGPHGLRKLGARMIKSTDDSIPSVAILGGSLGAEDSEETLQSPKRPGSRKTMPNRASRDDPEAKERAPKNRKRDRVKTLDITHDAADEQGVQKHATSSLHNVSKAALKRSLWKEKNTKGREDDTASLAERATAYEKAQWMIQKKALKEKFGDQAWNPKKRLSPDTLEGIRAMHASDPYRFTTPVLAEHFEVSPEAIRRILKSKWLPAPEEAEARRERWERRGEKVWSSLAEVGVKPPKPWRVRGVGKAEEPGEVPIWKDRNRIGTGREERKNAVKGAVRIRNGLVAERKSSELSPEHLPNTSGKISDRIL